MTVPLNPAPAPAPLASGAGQQHGSAVDSPATGNRGSEETGSVTSAGSASNTSSSSGTAASTGADAGAGSGSGAGAASGSHSSSDASHVGAAGTESFQETQVVQVLRMERSAVPRRPRARDTVPIQPIPSP